MTTDELTQEEQHWIEEWRRLRVLLSAEYPQQTTCEYVYPIDGPTDPPEGTAALVLPHD